MMIQFYDSTLSNINSMYDVTFNVLNVFFRWPCVIDNKNFNHKI